jgi:hypothetical protein
VVSLGRPHASHCECSRFEPLLHQAGFADAEHRVDEVGRAELVEEVGDEVRSL